MPSRSYSLAINSLGNSWLNSFSSSSSSCHLSSSVSFPYSLSNSSTSSFAFPKFTLFSHVSSSAVYPFYHTKNFSFPHTILLFKIFFTSNSSSSSMMTSFGGVFFCLSTCGLYSCTLLTFTTGCILIDLGSSNSTAALLSSPICKLLHFLLCFP